MNITETIVAPATAPGRAGIGIIRISGPNVKSIAQIILKKIPQPRYAHFTKFHNEQNEILDEGLAIYFPAPNSFTGEDILELHGHGGPVIMNLLINKVCELGARLARPGEFSERAFLNDKIDLTQAEAIADLIDAASEQAARSAIRSLQGEFSQKIHQLVEALIHLRMYVEAALDFPEEEINFLADNKITQQLSNILADLNHIQMQAEQGALLREGMNIVITGKPNAGKSSLLNALSGKDSAIVTEIPGTTRDILREQIVIDGLPINIIDTAGLRDSADVVEQEGIRRALAEVERADAILFIHDATQTLNKNDFPQINNSKKHWICIRNKIDLINELPQHTATEKEISISLSVKTGAGLDLLKQKLKDLVGFQAGQGAYIARQRHLIALTTAKNHLHQAQQQLQPHAAGELVAEELRLAQQALSEITGAFRSDDLLGKIFSSFCIGK